MNILVTGASGLIGNSLCKWFLNDYHLVTGVCRKTSTEISHPNYSQVIVDLEQEELNTNQNVDLLIHCAAIIPNKNNIFTESEFLNRNQQIDKQVFSFCLKRSTRIIYLSTAYMYTHQEEKEALNEITPLRDDLNGYYLSKRLGEENLAATGLPHTIFRLSSPYGNFNKQQNVMRLFSDRFRENLPVTLINNGIRKQNFIHLDDISEACNRVKDKNWKEVFNLSYELNYSMFELANTMKDIYRSESNIVFDNSKTEPELNLNFSNSKLKAELNWVPQINLRTGLLKTIAS